MYIALFDLTKECGKVLPIIDNSLEPIMCITRKEIKEKVKNSIFYGKNKYCIVNLDCLKWES